MADGLSLNIDFRTFSEMRVFLHRLVDAGIVRCLSPMRHELCDEPAVMVFWQDQAEYYPCCEHHIEHGEQWTGSTRVVDGYLSICVIPDKAREWLALQEPALQGRIELTEYERDPEG